MADATNTDKKTRLSAPRLIALAAGAILFVLILGNLPPMDAHDQAAPAPYLQGYARTIAGETIGYHSSYPDATSALIVRAGDGPVSAEWETEPVPAEFDASEATFIWLAGLASQKGAHRFDLAIDGRPAFAFRTARDADDEAWNLAGPGGSALSFKTTLVDQFGELFGFMTLKVPRAALTPGKPLRLRVTGENGGSRDWHMVFQYALKPFVRASGEAAVLKNSGSRGVMKDGPEAGLARSSASPSAAWLTPPRPPFISTARWQKRSDWRPATTLSICPSTR